ncbi:MAG: leucine-rich repeat protein [Clostridia bacterium]|nr:leucine-rich repeat protein [Clostridia bacterium]
MKKKLLSLITALATAACALAAFPASVSAAELYPLWIAGTRVTSENCGNVLGNGVFEYSKKTNTLSIHDDYDFNGDAVIKNEIDGLNICACNDLTLTNSSANGAVIQSLYGVCIKSDALWSSNLLTLTSAKDTICIDQGDLTVSETQLNVTASDKDSAAVRTDNGKLSVTHSAVTLDGGRIAVSARDRTSLTDCSYRVVDSIGIYAKQNVTTDTIDKAKYIRIAPVIGSVDIYGVTEPITGFSPVYNAPELDSDDCFVSSPTGSDVIYWTDRTAGRKMEYGEVFIKDHEYSVSVYVRATDHCEFMFEAAYVYSDPVLKATVNGNAAEAHKAFIQEEPSEPGTVVPVGHYSSNTISVTYSFGTPEPAPECGQGLTWGIKDTALVISGNWAMDNWDNFYDAPWYPYCHDIRRIEVNNFATSIGDNAFGYSDNAIHTKSYAFADTVCISRSVKSIGANAFAGCNALSDVYYGGTAADWAKISIAAGNEKLINAQIHYTDYSGTFGDGLEWACDGENLTISGTGAMPDFATYGKTPWNDQINNIKHLIVEEGITHIGAFTLTPATVSGQISALLSITLPSTVTSIGNNAFNVCKKLKDVKLPVGLETIGQNAFRYDESLTVINIPEGVREIDNFAFARCTSLAALYLPSTLERIGNSAFSDCNNIKDVYYNGTEAEWASLDKGSYNDVFRTANIHCAAIGGGSMQSSHGEKSLSYTVKPSADDGTVTVIAEGDVSEDEPLIVAAYNEKGVLTGIKLITRSEYSESVAAAEADSIRLMWWEMLSQRPNCDDVNIGL